MGMSLQQTKSRIKSIQATKKITNAMELVSTSKLKKAKEIHFQFAPYVQEVQTMMGTVSNRLEDKKNMYLLENDNTDKKIIILFSSSLGLCGGYNSNLFHYAQNYITSNDDLIVFGSKGCSYFKNKGYQLVKTYHELPQFNLKEKLTSEVAYYAIEQFKQKKISKVQVIYTQFINSLTFVPKILTILPLPKLESSQSFNKELLIEPKASTVLKELIPFYLTTSIKACLFESMLSEQASRRTAMENATDNAYELENQLMLEYNKARQAMITQEISEISGSADALK